jgi:hypothetical protein
MRKNKYFRFNWAGAKHEVGIGLACPPPILILSSVFLKEIVQ